MGLEPTIPVFERAKAVYTLNRAAIVIGTVFLKELIFADLFTKSPVFYGIRSFVRFNKSPLLIPILSQMNPVHTFHPVSLSFIFALSSYVRPGFPSSRFP
jgi:hypothetical protein